MICLDVTRLPDEDLYQILQTYDVLGWFSPTIIKVKILLQRVWESGVDWVKEIPQNITEEWLRWGYAGEQS